MRRQSARTADLTITTNDTQRELVQADARRVVIVRNCPPVWFADQRSSAPTARARLVFLGELGEQDRVERTVEILARLVNDRGMDVELLIVGDGPRRAAVEERAARLGLSDRVTITGWVPYEQVPVLLASAHVGLDTAPATEVNNGSTMVKIREYLVVGLPVVATALRETLVTGADAIVALEEDSAEAFVAPLLELLDSTEQWRASADRARARGMQLLWPTQREKLIAAYRDLDARQKEDAGARRSVIGAAVDPTKSSDDGSPGGRGDRDLLDLAIVIVSANRQVARAVPVDRVRSGRRRHARSGRRRQRLHRRHPRAGRIACSRGCG